MTEGNKHVRTHKMQEGVAALEQTCRGESIFEGATSNDNAAFLEELGGMEGCRIFFLVASSSTVNAYQGVL